MHRIEAHLTGWCPDSDLAPLTLAPLEDLLRIRRTPEDRQNTLERALSNVITGK